MATAVAESLPTAPRPRKFEQCQRVEKYAQTCRAELWAAETAVDTIKLPESVPPSKVESPSLWADSAG